MSSDEVGPTAELERKETDMFKKLSLVGATLAMGAATLIPATPAMARDGYYRGYDNHRGYNDRRGYRGDRYAYRNSNRNYRGYDGYYRCRRDGTAGTIIGAIAGGLLGNEVAGRGSRTEGTIIGGAVGALAGRAIDKSDSRCR
jgi:hypothetical protein